MLCLPFLIIPSVFYSLSLPLSVRALHGITIVRSIATELKNDRRQPKGWPVPLLRGDDGLFEPDVLQGRSW